MNVSTKKTMQQTTTSTGIVNFSNVTSGIYDVQVAGYTGENILNINGPNHTLVLGINVSQQQGNQLPVKQNKQTLPFSLPLLIGCVLIVGILIGGGVFAGILFFLKKIS